MISVVSTFKRYRTCIGSLFFQALKRTSASLCDSF